MVRVKFDQEGEHFFIFTKRKDPLKFQSFTGTKKAKDKKIKTYSESLQACQQLMVKMDSEFQNLIMSCIDLRALKTLVRAVEKKQGIQRTVATFNRDYYFRTTLKTYDFENLISIGQKINHRFRRQGDTKPTKFGNSELKLFTWVVVMYAHANQLLLQQMKEQDFRKLKQVFRCVELTRIVYEIKCFCYSKGQIETAWSPEEIELFEELVEEKNASEWKTIAFEMFKRSNCTYFRFFEQYREKWINYLNPQLNKGKWSIQDQIKMVSLVVTLGRRWAYISREFNCMRSEHTVKNHFKKLLRDFLKTKVLPSQDEKGQPDQNEIDRALLNQLIRQKSRIEQRNHGNPMQMLDAVSPVKREQIQGSEEREESSVHEQLVKAEARFEPQGQMESPSLVAKVQDCWEGRGQTNRGEQMLPLVLKEQDSCECNYKYLAPS